MKLTPIRATTIVVALLLGVAFAVVGPAADAGPSKSPIQWGSVAVGTAWKTVTFDQGFKDPVVVVGPPSADDQQRVTVRVRNVWARSFEVRLQDWNYTTRDHRAERVPYMVMEAGTHTVGGRTWSAGHANSVNHDWKTVGITGYQGDQTVLGSVVTTHGEPPVALRIDSVGDASFRVRLEEERGNDGAHANERVDYVVVPCCVDANNSLYRSGRVETNTSVAVEYPAMKEPLLFANVSSVKGSDPVALRNTGISNRRATIAVEEERSNGESRHAVEEIRYVVIDARANPTAGAPAPNTTTPTPIVTPPPTPPPTIVTVPPTTARPRPPATTTPPTTTPPKAPSAKCFRPGNAVRVKPNQDIAKIANKKPAGTTFLLTAGTHRLVDVSPKKGQTFVGERGPDCERLTTLNGAKQVKSWKSSNGKWKSTGHSRAVANRNVPCESGSARCDDAQDLYVNGNPLRHVSSVGAVKAGTWFFDYGSKTLWIGDNPNGKNVELSVAEAAFRPTADNVRIVGLKMEKYANQPQFGVIGRHGTAPGWVIEDNEIGVSHSVAAVLGPRARFVDNHVSRQGGLGVKVIGSGVVAANNTVVNGGWAGQLMTWEGGGIKISARGAKVNGNCVADNRGPGLWGDEGAYGLSFDRNTVFGNVTQGIFYEISDTATISNNRVGHNGERDPWMYGGQIMISTSSNVLVVGNTVEVNKTYGNGITVIWQDRHQGATVGNTVRNNDVTFLAKSGVTGMRSDWNGGRSIYQRNSFANNDYHSYHQGDEHFMGIDGSMTLSQLKRKGQETGSSIDAKVRATNWSCPGA